jgi:MtN3 and saliva related transmembrane protein
VYTTEAVISMATELVGWLSAIVLLATLGRQVYTQWRERSAVGLSRWLFIGQVSASLGLIVYSLLIQNWVFVMTSALLLLTALAGQAVVIRNRQRERDDNGGGKPSEHVVRVSRREFRAGRAGRSRGPRVG